MRANDSRKAPTVSNWGELKLLREIRNWLGDASPPSPEGIGDDAAILKNPDLPSVVTNDSLVYGKHFTGEAPPESVGAKLLKRCISDLAAMGAKPHYALLACLLPPDTSVEWLESVYRGLKRTALVFDIKIVGGDVTSTHRDLAFSMTLTGYLEADRPLTRKSGRPGDLLWVTGDLGGSSAGKHLHFEPRLEEGIWLANHGGVTSAIDISDGLGIDLYHLAPAVGVIRLDTAEIPISPASHEIAGSSGQSPLWHAFNDGEDYELLFTVQPGRGKDAFVREWQRDFDTPVTCIGRLEQPETGEGDSIRLIGPCHAEDLLGGYEHFRST